MFLCPEVVLQGPRVVAIVGQLKPAGMAKRTAERMPSACQLVMMVNQLCVV